LAAVRGCLIARRMTGNELLRRLRRLGRQRGVEVRLDELKGKGSHAALYYGARRTTLKDRRKEIGPGLLRVMLRQLGLSPRDLE
jgi:mRNA interferase HicA